MNLDDIKDQLRDQVGALWGRVQESTAYNTLKEQYDSWPQTAQRAAAFGAGFVTVLIVLSIPLSYISSANTSIEEFNEYRVLIRELLRVGRSAKEPPPLPAGLSAADMQAQIQGMTGEFNLLADQFTGASPLGDKPAPSLAPPVIHQDGVAVSYKKLNLTQVLDIGYRLQSLTAGTKLVGMQMAANSEDNHYYDVTYKLVNFSLPVSDEPESAPTRGSRPARDENNEGQDL